MVLIGGIPSLDGLCCSGMVGSIISRFDYIFFIYILVQFFHHKGTESTEVFFVSFATLRFLFTAETQRTQSFLCVRYYSAVSLHLEGTESTEVLCVRCVSVVFLYHNGSEC